MANKMVEVEAQKDVLHNLGLQVKEEEVIEPPQPPPEFEADKVEYEEPYRKVVPESELEFNYFFTTPKWGDQDVNPSLQEQFKKEIMERASKGEIIELEVDGVKRKFVSDGKIKQPKVKDYWGYLSMLTPDLSRANYDKRRYEIAEYWINLGGDFLDENMPRAAALCLKNGGLHVEMNQGIGGFLRNLQQTIIKRESSSHSEGKSSVFGKVPKEN
jgi:hypothetical protein